MSFFRTLALLLIALAGFSMGAPLGHGRPASQTDIPRPSLADAAAILYCWSGVIACLISGLGAWRTAAAWTLLGLGIAFALHRLKKRPIRGTVGTVHQGAAARRLETPVASPPGTISETLRAFAQAAGGFQSRVILNGIYYLALAPFGILAKWLGDPLRLKPSSQETFWTTKETGGESLDDARRQF